MYDCALKVEHAVNGSTETKCTHCNSCNTGISAVVDWTQYDPLTGLVWQHEKQSENGFINEAV